MAFTNETEGRVIRTLTVRKLIRTHVGTEMNKTHGNTTVEGDISVTVTEVAPGAMTDAELYSSAESLLSSALDLQFEENQELLRILSQVRG